MIIFYIYFFIMENELHQQAGNYLVSKYSSYDKIPDKYKYFYNIYIPMKSGTKRKNPF